MATTVRIGPVVYLSKLNDPRALYFLSEPESVLACKHRARHRAGTEPGHPLFALNTIRRPLNTKLARKGASGTGRGNARCSRTHPQNNQDIHFLPYPLFQVPLDTGPGNARCPYTPSISTHSAREHDHSIPGVRQHRAVVSVNTELGKPGVREHRAGKTWCP